jgi:peroxiredoxin
MPLKYEVGQKFPEVSLVDDREQEVSISEVAGGQPLILAFYRGPW